MASTQATAALFALGLARVQVHLLDPVPAFGTRVRHRIHLLSFSDCHLRWRGSDVSRQAHPLVQPAVHQTASAE